MQMPGCLLPWNNALTTDSEAAKGWSNEQLAAMRNKKQSKWQCAVKEVSMLDAAHTCSLVATLHVPSGLAASSARLAWLPCWLLLLLLVPHHLHHPSGDRDRCPTTSATWQLT